MSEEIEKSELSPLRELARILDGFNARMYDLNVSNDNLLNNIIRSGLPCVPKSYPNEAGNKEDIDDTVTGVLKRIYQDLEKRLKEYEVVSQKIGSL